MENNIVTVKLDVDTNQKLSMLKTINNSKSKAVLLKEIFDYVFDRDDILTELGLTKHFSFTKK